MAEKSGLKLLSGERVQKELLRLLEAPDPVPALLAMRTSGILAEILPAPAAIERLDTLEGVMRAHGLAPDAILLLAALLPSHEAARDVAAGLKLSNADRDRVLDALGAKLAVDASLSPEAARRVLYRVGARRFKDRLLLNWAEAQAGAKDGPWSALLALARAWQPPIFPLDGRDAMAAGVAEGPAVGRILAAVEQWWVEQGFAPGRDALLARLEELAAESKK
jgi:poly(A) polymerase